MRYKNHNRIHTCTQCAHTQSSISVERQKMLIEQYKIFLRVSYRKLNRCQKFLYYKCESVNKQWWMFYCTRLQQQQINTNNSNKTTGEKKNEKKIIEYFNIKSIYSLSFRFYVVHLFIVTCIDATIWSVEHRIEKKKIKNKKKTVQQLWSISI